MVTAAWGDVNARVRGLATHFPTGKRLAEMARSTNLAQLADALAEFGVVRPESVTLGAPAVEGALRRWVARQLDVLSWWCGPRRDFLTVIFEDEDRRSIRALIRGATQGAPWQVRLAGLIPTWHLGNRALQELAHCDSPRAITAMLTTWQNPYGPALARHARATRSDLLALEVDLNRVFLERSGAAARGGGPHLRRYVEDLVDLANVWSAIALAGRVDVDPETLFVEGGRMLSPRRFRSAVRDSETAIQALGHSQERTAIANALARAGDSGKDLEAALLSAQITEQRYLSRFDPLSTAPIVLFALRLRAVVVDVRRIAWGIGLGAAAPLLAEGLISPT